MYLSELNVPSKKISQIILTVLTFHHMSIMETCSGTFCISVGLHELLYLLFYEFTSP